MAKLPKHIKSKNEVIRKATPRLQNVSRINFNFEKWLPIIIAAFAFILYANTLTHDYVLDDETVMAKNSMVTKGIKAVPEIMVTAYRAGAQDRQENLYRPLSVAMFAVEWQLSPNQAFLGHLINVVLYALIGFLLYKLLRLWLPTKHSFVLFVITLLFVAHPLHTEVVANIKSRDEILGMLFGILSMQFFFYYANDKNILSIKNLLLGFLFFFLAMLSKESTITLFAVIPFSIYFFTLQHDFKKIFIAITSLTIAVIAYFILRHISIGGLVTFNEVSILNNSLMGVSSPVDRFATAIVLIGYYLKLFFFPFPLSFDYSLNTIPNASLSDVRFLLTMLIIIAMAAYVLLQLKKKDIIAFSLIFFATTLSVVTNIFVLIEATLAERFMFLPSLGLCMALILLLEKYLHYFAEADYSLLSIVKQNKLFTSLVFAFLLVFTTKSFLRNFDWKDNYTLFSIDKDHNPNSYRTLSAYCNALFVEKIKPLQDGEQQKLDYCREAIFYTHKSLAITQDNFSAWSLLSYCYLQIKDYPNAIAAFENGIKFYSTKAPALDNFYMLGANAYYYSGNLQQAVSTAKAGLAINDTNAMLLNTYGMVLTETNDLKTAKMALEKSIQLDSSNADTWYNYGNWYAKNNDFQAALNCYKKIESRTTAMLTKINAYNNSGNCYAVLKQYDNAIAYYKKVLTLDAKNKSALQNLVLTYNNMGQPNIAASYQAQLNQ